MTQLNRIGTHKTTVTEQFIENEKFTIVTYHETPIVKFNDRMIILNTSGYHTGWNGGIKNNKSITTKKRMNQTAEQFNLPFSVSQMNKTWYISLQHENGQEYCPKFLGTRFTIYLSPNGKVNSWKE